MKRLRRLFRAWLNSSVANRIILGSQVTTLALLLLVGLLIFPLFYIGAISDHRAYVAERAGKLGERQEERFELISQQLEQLSRNSLVVNAYVDSIGRETYLQPLLRDFRFPFAIQGSIVLFDANFKPFAANLAEFSRPLPGIAKAAEQVIKSGKQGAIVVDAVNGKQLVLIFPIFYPPSGTTEGALVSMMDAAGLFKSLTGTGHDKACIRVSFDEQPTASIGCSESRLSGEASRPLNLIGKSIPMVLSYSEPLGPLMGKFGLMMFIYLAAGVLIMGVAFVLSRREARRFAAKLTELANVSRTIIVSRRHENIKVEWGQPDEIGKFVRSFNDMVDELYRNQILLEARVKERTAELKSALDKADAANAAKSRFLATMSHEIRTPMNGILGVGQLLMEPNLGDVLTRKYAGIILSSGNTLLALLNDILDLSKAEAGHLTLSSVPLDPREVVGEIVELFSAAAFGKNLRIETDFTNLSGRAYLGDVIRLRQMLSNLLSNAIKFTDHGRALISVEEVSRAGDDAQLLFTVADDGVGIAEEKLDDLFKPFSQVDESSTRKYGGSGLGLFIVGTLAGLMGGDAGVRSKVGVGSSFWFTVRMKVKDSGIAPLIRTQPRAILERPALGGKVLVAEDNLLNLMLITTMLEKAGLQVVASSNGQEALEARKTGEFQTILMDCQMPVMDGYQATKEIRNWEIENGMPRIPIVALTAAAFAEDRERCASVGMDDFLSKPVDMASLWKVLEAWLGQSLPG